MHGLTLGALGNRSQMQEKTVDLALEAVVSSGTSALQNSAMCTGASDRAALASSTFRKSFAMTAINCSSFPLGRSAP
jgi:hypothetical protein